MKFSALNWVESEGVNKANKTGYGEWDQAVNSLVIIKSVFLKEAWDHEL